MLTMALGQGKWSWGDLRHEISKVEGREISDEDLKGMIRENFKAASGGIHLGPSLLDHKNTAILQRMDKFRKRTNGSFAESVSVAAGAAKTRGQTFWLYLGNSHMHSVWHIVDSERKTLGWDNGGQFVFSITPELEIYKHEVLGRIALEASSRQAVKEVMAAKARTFLEARNELMAFLASKHWKLSDKTLKVPYATSPNGEVRLWFKAQAVYFTEGHGHSLNNARTLSYDLDIRKTTPEQFYHSVEKMLPNI